MNSSDPELHTVPPDRRSMDDQPAWRHDFPIDWPEDHYIARRDFTKFLVLTSFAFVVGQIWIAIQNWRRRWRGEPLILKIADVNAVPVGPAIQFNYPNDLFIDGRGRLFVHIWLARSSRNLTRIGSYVRATKVILT